MSYTALYRKWRPQTFNDVLGQEHIVKTLKNQIHADRISHAYLFCGTRGTGKTSTAKIFAKAVNCCHAIDFEPCGVCGTCNEQASGISLNVIEIDAASNNGVDNIRELREEVRYPPTKGNYKVYIIDEVHMLSTGAFNALLKTLEEPPPHVIFILATTDPQKIPATIHSRCQRFDFRRITAKEITNRLAYYMSCEKIEAAKSALHYIAKLADGSMRDALSILDQCISFYYDEHITLDKVLEITGSVDNEILFKMIDACNKMNTKDCLDIVEKIISMGRDVLQFLNELIDHCRNLLISNITVDIQDVLDVSEESIIRLSEQSSNMTQEKMMYYIRTFSDLTASIKYSSNPRVLLEITLVKITRPANDQTFDGVLQRIIRLEKDFNGILNNTVPIPKQPKEKVIAKTMPKAIDSDVQKLINDWNNLKGGFDLGCGLDALLNETSLGTLNDNKLFIICDNYVSKKLVEKNINNIIEALKNKYDKEFILDAIEKVEFDYKYNNLFETNINSQYDDEFEEFRNILPGIEII